MLQYSKIIAILAALQIEKEKPCLTIVITIVKEDKR